MTATMRVMSILAVAVSTSTGYPLSYISENVDLLWKEFKHTYSKNYNSSDEEVYRKKLFKKNLEIGSELEKINKEAKFGVNTYSDWSSEEFKKMHNLNLEDKKSQLITSKIKNNTIPASIDWRQRGAVTHIKNQGQCGSCWAFASIGSIEGQWKISGNDLTSLSEQYLVSCDTDALGCVKGAITDAYNWLVDSSRGLVITEASYPYTSSDGITGICKNTSDKAFGAVISSHINIEQSEAAIAIWVGNHGPVSTAVDATSWQTYSSGILSNCQGKKLDHGVLIVGYAPGYWILKNSWGINWGESGYIRIARGSNQCLLQDLPSIAVVTGKLPPSPPTPLPTPTPARTFTQIQCTNNICSETCEGYFFPIGQCLPTGTGSVVVSSCTATLGLIMNQYATNNCVGASSVQYMPVGLCRRDVPGAYSEIICGQVPGLVAKPGLSLKL